MSHYAQVNSQGIVEQVIVAEADFIQSGAVGDPNTWIQTSYNTEAGVHPENRPLRKNFAGVGYTYDRVRDAFIAMPATGSPTPWQLDEFSCTWSILLTEVTTNWIWDPVQHTWQQVQI